MQIINAMVNYGPRYGTDLWPVDEMIRVQVISICDTDSTKSIIGTS